MKTQKQNSLNSNPLAMRALMLGMAFILGFGIFLYSTNDSQSPEYLKGQVVSPEFLEGEVVESLDGSSAMMESEVESAVEPTEEPAEEMPLEEGSILDPADENTMNSTSEMNTSSEVIMNGEDQPAEEETLEDEPMVMEAEEERMSADEMDALRDRLIMNTDSEEPTSLEDEVEFMEDTSLSEEEEMMAMNEKLTTQNVLKSQLRNEVASYWAGRDQLESESLRGVAPESEFLPAPTPEAEAAIGGASEYLPESMPDSGPEMIYLMFAALMAGAFVAIRQ